ncbi:hypothetical protein DPMN_130587 [Dreissena polymorpha]|uniref:Uncharacterized protein n=1 Tax=Dreissena polymorpha TaxID=45954 RepID=A0A9D4JXP4_DREPO|nr:hypothetical protein DPMN_130587 [Dreissena polymorpha]
MARQRPTRGAPGLIMGPCIVEIDRIVIRYVQYQFEVSRCRNEELIENGNFWLAWSMWAGARQVEIDRIVIRDAEYQFEEVIVKGNFGWAWSMWVGRSRAGNGAMDNVQYQFEVLGEELVATTDGQTDRQTDGQTAEITTISPRFSKSSSPRRTVPAFQQLRKSTSPQKKGMTSLTFKTNNALGDCPGMMYGDPEKSKMGPVVLQTESTKIQICSPSFRKTSAVENSASYHASQRLLDGAFLFPAHGHHH